MRSGRAGRHPLAAILAPALALALLSGCASNPAERGLVSNERPDRGDSAASSQLQGNWIEIQPGDTLAELARQADIPLLRLERFNPNVKAGKLVAGQTLLIPTSKERAPGSGPYRYQIRPGDTYAAIGRLFNVRMAAIQAANPGMAATRLLVGELIKVPVKGSLQAGSRQTANLDVPDKLPDSARGFRWPLDDYQVLREFGPDQRGGLQPMLLGAEEGARARAVAGGEVRFVGSLRQLGQVVIVHHPDNIQSVYAQCDTPEITVDSRINEGDFLCTLASTADGTSELMFDLRHGAKPINPRLALK